MGSQKAVNLNRYRAQVWKIYLIWEGIFSTWYFDQNIDQNNFILGQREFYTVWQLRGQLLDYRAIYRRMVGSTSWEEIFFLQEFAAVQINEGII